MNDTEFVTVIIPTYNRAKSVEKCVNSVIEQDYPKDKFEFLVIDDGSSDNTKETLEKYAKNANFRYYYQKNQGASSARNQGIRSAKGEIICFIDDDCIAERDWMKNLVKGFSDRTVGGVGGKIIANKPVTLIEKYSERNKFFDQASFIEVMIMGANAAYRREILKAIGGFDIFFRTGEDTELGLRIRLAGFRLTYAPEAVVLHNHMSNFRSMIKQIYGYGKGYASLNRKYLKNFSPAKRIRMQLIRLVRKVLVTPFKVLIALSKEEKSYYIAEPFLDMSIMIANILGLLVGMLKGEKYQGNKVTDSLDFIEKSHLPGGWGS